jgi:hypothetical protein
VARKIKSPEVEIEFGFICIGCFDRDYGKRPEGRLWKFMTCCVCEAYRICTKEIPESTRLKMQEKFKKENPDASRK